MGVIVLGVKEEEAGQVQNDVQLGAVFLPLGQPVDPACLIQSAAVLAGAFRHEKKIQLVV